MPENTTRIVGTPNNYRPDRGGATLMNMPIIGVVKNNIDPTHSGRVQVYLAQFQQPNPDDSANWVTVSYLSPFHGTNGNNNNPSSDATTDGYGKYVGNPQSYGFWASAPDIGSEVLCIFANGDPQQGYYIGCIPKAGMLSMTPSLGSTQAVVPNSAEAKSYGGADRLPTGEVNTNNPNLDNSATVNTDPKPIQSYQASILQQQGLLRDNDRGTVSSSASRESPSRVFGMSTPGGPIYEGGYTNQTIGQAAVDPATSDAKLGVVGRTGGHSFTMDDGDLEGQNQMVRLRSSAGHMILMNDSSQSMFMIHANGQTWVEMGAEGTIDLYSTNSVNIRTEGDLNFHADRDINMHAAKDFTIYADNFNVEADTNTNIRTGADFAQYTVGDHTLKVDGAMALASKGEASLASSAVTYLNGDKINLNTGSASTTPAEVQVLTKSNHPDTTYSTSKGWLYPSPDALLSVTSRAPTHQPYIGSGKGVDIKVKNEVDSSVPTTTPAVDKINAATPNVPNRPTTPTITGTVPPVKATNPLPNLNTAAVTAMAGQQANINSTLPGGLPPPQAIAGSSVRALTKRTDPPQSQPQVSVFEVGNSLESQDPLGTLITGIQSGVAPESKRNIGILEGNGGVTLYQATMPGSILKPGSRPLLQARLAQGMPYQYALQGLVTGNYGASNPYQVLRNNSVQLAAVGFAVNSASQSLYNQGYFTGQESAAQAGGIVMAASAYGLIPQVTYINGQGYSTAGVIALSSQAVGLAYDATGKVYDMVAAGNFSGQLSDAISNGVSGLATSIGDAIQNTARAIGSTLENIATALESTLRSAFNAVEASFKVLTEDVPNYIGGRVAAISANIDSANARYESADREIELNKIIYDSARTAYRNDPSPENAASLQSAEAALSESRKEAARAGLSFLTGNAVQNTNNDVRRLGEQVPQPVTTANSGLNALPGGMGAIVNQVTPGGQSIISLLNYSSSAQNAINRSINPSGNPYGPQATQFLNPQIYAGNLVQGTISAANAYIYRYAAPAFNAANAVTALTGGSIPATYVISNTISGIVSTLQTSISSIGYGGQIRPVTQATNTFFRTSITSNTGQLIQDPRVPLPISVTYTQKDNSATQSDTSVADKVLKEQADSVKKISDIKDKISETQNKIVSLTLQNDKNPNSATQSQIESLQTKKDELQKQLVEASSSYSSTVTGQNNPPQQQSAWSKWWSGDRSDSSKYFQWDETPQQKYARLGSAYTRTGQ